MPVIFTTHCCYGVSIGNHEAETLIEFYQCSFIVKHTTVVWDACINSPWTQQLSLWCFVSWSSVCAVFHMNSNGSTRVAAIWTPVRGLSKGWRLNDPPQPQGPVVSGACDRTTAGLDEGLLWPLPHLSPFTLQPVGKGNEITIRKSFSSTHIYQHKRWMKINPLTPLNVQVSISKGPSELTADSIKTE